MVFIKSLETALRKVDVDLIRHVMVPSIGGAPYVVNFLESCSFLLPFLDILVLSWTSLLLL